MENGSGMIYNQRINHTLKNKAKNLVREFLQMDEDRFEIEDADSEKMSNIIHKIIRNERK